MINIRMTFSFLKEFYSQDDSLLLSVIIPCTLIILCVCVDEKDERQKERDRDRQTEGGTLPLLNECRDSLSVAHFISLSTKERACNIVFSKQLSNEQECIIISSAVCACDSSCHYFVFLGTGEIQN